MGQMRHLLKSIYFLFAVAYFSFNISLQIVLMFLSFCFQAKKKTVPQNNQDLNVINKYEMCQKKLLTYGQHNTKMKYRKTGRH